jgi:type II secretory pathway pseudopilin PulG
MIVVGIIAILAAIAIPQFSAYRLRGYNAAAKSDLKNAYTAAQAYFGDSPAATIDASKLTLGGFVGTSNVTLTVSNGLQSTLSMPELPSVDSGCGIPDLIMPLLSQEMLHDRLTNSR